MTKTINKYTHNGDEKTPYILITGYTYGSTTVERWTYTLFDTNKMQHGKESDKFNSGESAYLNAMDVVNASLLLKEDGTIAYQCS